MNKDICECGHHKNFHLGEGECVYGYRIGNKLIKKGCSCKKFKPKCSGEDNYKGSKEEWLDNQVKRKGAEDE